MAGQCALAVQRAELFEQKSEVASILQRAILHVAFLVLRVRLAARYLPAEAGMDVGGDWYDAFHDTDGRLWLSVGDVAGHGVEAASVMGQLRNSIRATAYARSRPGRGPRGGRPAARRQRDDQEEDLLVATAIVVALDSTSGRLVWSNAGHLPPVLMPAVGPPVLMEDRHGPLLGVGYPGRELGSALLGMGDLILLYTDGLVEKRGEALDVGLSRLLDTVSQLPASDGPSAVADRALASSLSGITRRDDLCVLAIQRHPGPAGAAIQ